MIRSWIVENHWPKEQNDKSSKAFSMCECKRDQQMQCTLLPLEKLNTCKHYYFCEFLEHTTSTQLKYLIDKETTYLSVFRVTVRAQGQLPAQFTTRNGNFSVLPIQPTQPLLLCAFYVFLCICSPQMRAGSKWYRFTAAWPPPEWVWMSVNQTVPVLSAVGPVLCEGEPVHVHVEHFFFSCFKYQVTIQEIESKIDSIVGLEEEAQSFAQFITTGESARIKAKLTQIRRYWEELQEHARGLEGTILGHLSQQQKFEENLRKVRIGPSKLMLHIQYYMQMQWRFQKGRSKERPPVNNPTNGY